MNRLDERLSEADRILEEKALEWLMKDIESSKTYLWAKDSTGVSLMTLRDGHANPDNPDLIRGGQGRTSREVSATAMCVGAFVAGGLFGGGIALMPDLPILAVPMLLAAVGLMLFTEADDGE